MHKVEVWCMQKVWNRKCYVLVKDWLAIGNKSWAQTDQAISSPYQTTLILAVELEGSANMSNTLDR